MNYNASMIQSFEYYKVDPSSWQDAEKITDIISCSVDHDSESNTIDSASFEMNNNVGECYIRPYLILKQNKEVERVPLGVYLVQTPETNFDGVRGTVSIDAYSPLMELKEKYPDVGYSITKNTELLSLIPNLVRSNLRAPVKKISKDEQLLYDDYVSELDDTWMEFINKLLSNKTKYHICLADDGTVYFDKNKNVDKHGPVWNYSSNGSTILYPEINVKEDIYGLPNKIEVMYNDENNYMYSSVTNDNPNSILSTVSRGRTIVYRETSPSIVGVPSQEELDEYANAMLKKLSTISVEITYKHGYCPVRIGDIVSFDYPEVGLNNVKAKVTKQVLRCEVGCEVSETAVYAKKLWDGE